MAPETPTPIVLLPDANASTPDGPRPPGAGAARAHRTPGSPGARRFVSRTQLGGLIDPDLHVRLGPDRLGSARGALTFAPPAWGFAMEPEPLARWELIRPMHDDSAWEAEAGNQGVCVIIDLEKLSPGAAYVVAIAVRAEANPQWIKTIAPAKANYVLEQSETTWSREAWFSVDAEQTRTLQIAFTASSEKQRLRLLPEALGWLEVYDVEVRKV
jgi:hypothetical protein